jgi:hypothetical protein
MEIGPYRVKDGSSGPKLEYNSGSWNEFANVMFVDNPVGTGFSFVDTDSYVHELPEMASQFVQFLEKFFALFPEYEHDDVSYASPSRTHDADKVIALPSRRILRWPTHPLYCEGDLGPKQRRSTTPMAIERNADWKWLDLARGAVQGLPLILI